MLPIALVLLIVLVILVSIYFFKKDSVEMVLSANSIQPGEALTLTIINSSWRSKYYGEAYYIEHYVNNQWHEVDQTNGGAWIDVAYTLKHGKKYEQVVENTPLVPGRYRICKVIRSKLREDAKEQIICAEFIIQR